MFGLDPMELDGCAGRWVSWRSAPASAAVDDGNLSGMPLIRRAQGGM